MSGDERRPYDSDQCTPLMFSNAPDGASTHKQVPDVHYQHPTATPAAGDPHQTPTQVVQYQPQPTVVVVNASNGQPDDYLQASIWLTLCCCWPIGIFAILKSIKCRDARTRGDVAEARTLSKATLRLLHWTVGVGVALNVVSIIVSVAFGYWFYMSVIQEQQRGREEQAGFKP